MWRGCEEADGMGYGLKCSKEGQKKDWVQQSEKRIEEEVEEILNGIRWEDVESVGNVSADLA